MSSPVLQRGGNSGGQHCKFVATQFPTRINRRTLSPIVDVSPAARHATLMTTTIHPHSTHWGAFDAVVRDGELAEIRPYALDADPTPLLGNIKGAARHPARVAQPVVRKGWLERGCYSTAVSKRPFQAARPLTCPKEQGKAECFNAGDMWAVSQLRQHCAKATERADGKAMPPSLLATQVVPAGGASMVFKIPRIEAGRA
mgnify:CR=1 FL=1